MEGIDEDKASHIFNIKKNQLKMVERRGFDISKEKNMLETSKDAFIDAYVPFARKQKKTLREVISHVYTNAKGEKLYVFFADPEPKKKQLGTESIGLMIQNMDKNRSKNAILITPLPLSSKAGKKLQDLLTYSFSIFNEGEMSYDPTEHYLVPAHRGMGVEEQRDFLQRNKLSVEQFPIMLASDIIARYYGFRPGMIVEIKKINLYDTIVQNSLSYRYVKLN